MRGTTLFEAYLDDYHKIVVYMSKDSYEGKSSCFYLRDMEGKIVSLEIVSCKEISTKYYQYILTFQEELQMGMEYYVVNEYARSTVLEYAYIVKTKHFDEMYAYENHDLGCVYQKESSTFRLWAPTAYRVKLELMRGTQIEMYEMKRLESGIFLLEIPGDLEGASYVYFIRIHGLWQESVDPYGVVSTANSKRSVIVDMSKVIVPDDSLPPLQSVCDAIVYEMHIRDMTSQKAIGVTHPRTFQGFIEENVETNKYDVGLFYVKSLGVTHIQLMPVLDFGSVDDLHPDLFYNWGYDPVQFRCLEGSYAVHPEDPYAPMKEFAQLVATCHRNGLRVNLDVVWNHVYDLQKHALQLCVPNYYFQMNEHGEFSNASYCGNDIDSTRKMCSKYLVDTCIHLVKHYHIDGFRFDLMGILDIHTIQNIYEACKHIKEDFMVYGEGWHMPSYVPDDMRASIPNHERIPHIAHFNDRFRDIVKGKTDCAQAHVKGFCSGELSYIEGMKHVLCGSCIAIGHEKMFDNPSQSINYVECHDNLTVWDKLMICCQEDTEEIRRKKHEMMIAAVLLAQGIPFLHAGQEFARTKHGMANTYQAGDTINQLDYDRRNQWCDMVEHTKALIEIRKAYACLRYNQEVQVRSNIHFEDIDGKVLLYKIQDQWNDMIVMFNPTSNKYYYDFKTNYYLLYYFQKVTGEVIQNVWIEPYATIIVSKDERR